MTPKRILTLSLLAQLITQSILATRATPILILNTNTLCYLNAALQTIMASSLAERITQAASSDPLIQNIQAFIRYYTDPGKKTADPNELFTIVKAQFKYEDSIQEDSGEFLEKIIDHLNANQIASRSAFINFATVNSLLISQIPKPPTVPQITKKDPLLDRISTVAQHTKLLNPLPHTLYIAIPSELPISTITENFYMSGSAATESPLPGQQPTAHYSLRALIIRTVDAKEQSGPGGHYFALTKYGTSWYRLDEFESYGTAYSINRLPTTKDLIMPEIELRKLFKDATIQLNNQWGIIGKGIATATVLMYEKVITPAEQLQQLADQCHLLQILAKNRP